MLVYSEDDWRRGITHALAKNEIRAFILSQDFVVSRPLLIPAGLGGLHVVANPGVKITPKATMDQLFKVQSPDVVISRVRGDSPSAARTFDTFVTVDSDSSAGRFCDRLEIEGCRFTGGAFIEAAVDGTFAARIVGNTMEDSTGGALAIQVPDIYWLVEGNVATSYGAFLATIGVGAGFARVLGNGLGGATIDTSLGIGQSVIDDNVNCGAITATGPGDRTGINT